MYRRWHGGYYGHRRGGCFLPGLLLFGLFILVFGKLLLPLLIVLFCVGPFVFWSKRAWWGRDGGWQDYKRKWHDDDDYPAEKPKRGGDGGPVEIV